MEAPPQGWNRTGSLRRARLVPCFATAASQIKVMEAEVDESRRRHEKDKLTIDTMNNALQSLKARATELEQVVAVVLGRVVLRMSRFRNCVSQTARLTRLARKQ